jgi:hypothetical protein
MIIHASRTNKVAAACIGIVVLLVLVVGSILLVNNQSNHAAASRASAVASASAQANAAKVAQAKVAALAKVKAAQITAAAQVAAAKTAAAAKVAAAKAAKPAVVAAPEPAGLTNASAVVSQFYQDITDQNYAAAWALGGNNIGGTDYAAWAAGYDTTASIDLGTVSDFGADQVDAGLIATQTDGSVKTYEGTYTVSNGVIVSASIVQTS